MNREHSPRPWLCQEWVTAQCGTRTARRGPPPRGVARSATVRHGTRHPPAPPGLYPAALRSQTPVARGLAQLLPRGLEHERWRWMEGAGAPRAPGPARAAAGSIPAGRRPGSPGPAVPRAPAPGARAARPRAARPGRRAPPALPTSPWPAPGPGSARNRARSPAGRRYRPASSPSHSRSARRARSYSGRPRSWSSIQPPGEDRRRPRSAAGSGRLTFERYGLASVCDATGGVPPTGRCALPRRTFPETSASEEGPWPCGPEFGSTASRTCRASG
jgi:hypothetical protein